MNATPATIGVVIRFKDSAATLPEVLEALQRQTRRPDRLVGVNTGASDNSAELITRADEVVELIGNAGEFAEEGQRPVAVLDELSDGERLVYEAMPARGVRTPDEIAVASGLPAAQVLGPLAMLELAGLVRRQEGRWQIIRKTV